MTSAPARAFEQLCQNRLFEGIGTKVLERIRPDVNILQLKRGDVVFKEGDLGDSLYLVGEGSIKISKQGRGGRQEVLDYIQTGNFFGEVALSGGQPHSAMASAEEPTVLGAVKEETFQHIFFFSSRRRHTRLQGDWSSDVCSSDLRGRRPRRERLRGVRGRARGERSGGAPAPQIGRASCRERVYLLGDFGSGTIQGRWQRHRRCYLKKPMTSAPAKAYPQMSQNRLF